jgi:hypothetical protein
MMSGEELKAELEAIAAKMDELEAIVRELLALAIKLHEELLGPIPVPDPAAGENREKDGRKEGEKDEEAAR